MKPGPLAVRFRAPQFVRGSTAPVIKAGDVLVVGEIIGTTGQVLTPGDAQSYLSRNACEVVEPPKPKGKRKPKGKPKQEG